MKVKEETIDRLKREKALLEETIMNQERRNANNVEMQSQSESEITQSNGPNEEAEANRNVA